VQRAAIVTGASRGIGAAIAKTLARDGFAVCVNYLHDEAAAGKVVAEIAGAGGMATAVQADITDTSQISRLFECVENMPAQLCALVNNAGFTGGRKDFADLTAGDFNAALGTNLIGPALCMQQAAARMAKSRGGNGGAVVNVISRAAVTGGRRLLPYATAKAGLAVMTVALARELADEGIRVNGVSPGVIDTELASRDHGDPAGVAAAIPLGRAGLPQEVAETVSWLLSDKASYVTGAVVPVAGGQ
jgi:NAD(P)-dependent dehydrogenase (short-subunit alcohol dehydrogenase family)